MNLYLLSQTVNNDYDTFDSCVVCADNEDDARMINPNSKHFKANIIIYEESKQIWIIQDNGKFICTDDTWCNPKDIEVKLIGKADKSIQKGVVCASFNAG